LFPLYREVATFCRQRPFDDVTDNSFVETAVSQPLTLTTMIGDLDLPRCVEKDALTSALSSCLRVNPDSRINCHRLAEYLDGCYQARVRLSRPSSHEETG
jgi:hypothetical protein